MEEIFQLLIEYKNLHPIRFWFVIALIVVVGLAFLTLVFIRVKRKKTLRKKDNALEKKSDFPTALDPSVDSPVEEESRTEKDGYMPGFVHSPLKEEKSDVKPPNRENTPIKKRPKEALPEAREETEQPMQSKNEILRVDYASLIPEQTCSYPIFRCPKPNTVVRSYRTGATKRRGYKEDSFQQSIEHFFGSHFKVSGRLRLNTGKSTRPFEPDIALIEKEKSTLRIDIEIDEPYAGITRQPTHCKGEDALRDTYFVDRGWIVIRFSEYQVHHFEKPCLRFVADVISSVFPGYDIPVALNDIDVVGEEPFWDVVKAQKWEKEKYREKYLQHEFKRVLAKPETLERGFDEQEAQEEAQVQPTSIGVLDQRTAFGFNLENRHPRDARIEFYPEPHVYTIDGAPTPAVSTIVSKFFPEFDADYWSARKAPSLGMSPVEVARMWKQKGEKAAQDGAFLHEQIENFFLNQDYHHTDEFNLFEAFLSDHKGIQPYRSEWRIFDEEYHVAGTVDLISKNGIGYELYDWKRSKKVVNPITGKPITDNPWGCGIGQLNEIDDTAYNRYCLQQSIYRCILEKKYGIKITKMNLVMLYPEYDKYYVVDVPYQKPEVEYILNAL